MKCNELLCGEQDCDVHCLFSKGFHLLVDSCRSCNDDVHLACLKLLYLANLFYNRFKEMVVKSPQLVSCLFCYSSSFFVKHVLTSIRNADMLDRAI